MLGNVVVAAGVGAVADRSDEAGSHVVLGRASDGRIATDADAAGAIVAGQIVVAHDETAVGGVDALDTDGGAGSGVHQSADAVADDPAVGVEGDGDAQGVFVAAADGG